MSDSFKCEIAALISRMTRSASVNLIGAIDEVDDGNFESVVVVAAVDDGADSFARR
jgi:hypothetical protein